MKAISLISLALMWSATGFAQTQAVQASADQQIPTLTDYFRTAPLYVVGHIRFEKAHRLFHDEVAGFQYLEGSLQPNQDLQIWLDKTELRINTQGGLLVTLAGIPVSVTSLKYNNVTGVVEVESSVMGLDAGNFYAERRMAQEIREKFRPKLQEAFTRLLRVRHQKSLGDAGFVLNEVINVFKDRKPGKKPGTPLPTFTGEVSLMTRVPKTQTVRIGPVVTDLKEGDLLDSAVAIRVPMRSKLQVRGLKFSSVEGLTLRQSDGSPNGVKTATLKSFSASEKHGFQLDATNGADDMISGTRLLITLMRVADQGGNINDSSFVQTRSATIIQQIITAKVEDGLQNYVRTHREDLLKAGATPELLDALEVDHPQIGALPYIN